MRVLLVGAGGVGGSIALIAARRDFFDVMVVADFDAARAADVAASTGDARFVPAQVDASDSAAVTALLNEHRCDVLMNATDPRFVMPLFRAALAGGANYLDMAMSLSRPHPTEPYAQTGVKLGDEQFEMADDWVQAGQLALVGMGIEPGMADVFARYAADELFSEIEELGVRDGANLVVPDTTSPPASRSGPPSRSA
jgi:saccharopine dehydrogenase-like NADP-dependent oxidoreductase